MRNYILEKDPRPDQSSWNYRLPNDAITPPISAKPKGIGKFVKFTPDSITFYLGPLPNNRILQTDDPSKFILASFSELRFPDVPMRVGSDYINRLMKTGFFLNGVQYRFYHHSNSQLRSRSCFLREASSDAELDERIYKLGDFSKIMNAAKRAKRIGLLFSSAEVDFVLDPKWTADIDDITSGDENFSDGCGLIAPSLAKQISKAKHIIFREKRYTPSVYQIRYLGYKGVLMLHPELDTIKDQDQRVLAQFRRSMKKFSTTTNTTFSVVDHSLPYAFGRLNNDIIVLLSSLGISNESLLAKQEEYFNWISKASRDPIYAVDFLSCLGEHDLAKRVLLDGIENDAISKKVSSLQRAEINNFKKRDKMRARMIIHKSRLIFGVCDPYGILKEGQVHIRITSTRKGPTTPINGDVLVVRNPCLHPGDCLKLRAVSDHRLSHLVDCIVFASVARPGHHSAPAMSSGGDLDGDRYFVCWDSDLVPRTISESYDYPANKERLSTNITRADLANHFASYNSAGLAKVASLHQKWVRSSPKGALSSQCQELNALHSQSVDGARIKIPDRLLTPPESDKPYIIDLLAAAAENFATRFMESHPVPEVNEDTQSAEENKFLILSLLRSQQSALSEYEIFQMAYSVARRYSIEFRPLLVHLDFGAFSTQQKYALSSALRLTPEDDPYIWNSLVRSNILQPRDLEQRQLNKVLPLQRLYSSETHGLGTFFQYLKIATQEFTRKLLILQTDERFSIGIFIRGSMPWDEDPSVSDNVVVCSFMPHTSDTLSTYRPCTRGYRLHLNDNGLQLYKEAKTADPRSDTFIFVTRQTTGQTSQIVASVALQKISDRVQKQLGRLRRTPVVASELHVVSNRDRVAHQLFDLYFEHVPTEDIVRRFYEEAQPYRLNTVASVDWGRYPSWIGELFATEKLNRKDQLKSRSLKELEEVIAFCLEYRAEDELFYAFDAMICTLPLTAGIPNIVDRFPPLAFSLLKTYPPDDSRMLDPKTEVFSTTIIRNIIRSANALGIASLAALERISSTIATISMAEYLDLLVLTVHSVRHSGLVQEVLFVLNDARTANSVQSDISTYVHKCALSVAMDRAEEAADECPCDEKGIPRKRRDAFPLLQLVPVDHTSAIAHIRIDKPSAVRLHSHVRLQAASEPESGPNDIPILDGIVVRAAKGECKIELQYPPPHESSKIKWRMYTAGSVATFKAMMDALVRLYEDGADCCGFHQSIVNPDAEGSDEEQSEPEPVPFDLSGTLNESQAEAVQSCVAPLSLIWGPPGTGKTTVVVQIIRRLLQQSPGETKVLMTASTHNAVDNVLERFVAVNKQENILAEDKILRVATDSSKVHKSLQSYTIDARIGGDMNENNKLVKQAQARVKSAVVVFTTCAGAGLGTLRKIDFDVAIIDEASQITEPCALIPLVKGCQRGILVGDYKQLRPTVGKLSRMLNYDVSLLERLYEGKRERGIRRTLLNVQYRFTHELAKFPSDQFYEGKLKTHITDSSKVLNVLRHSTFPWPCRDNIILPTVFVQCEGEESMGSTSKSNPDQVEVIQRIMALLQKPSSTEGETHLTITILSPYTKQISLLKNQIKPQVPCYTIDSFQGRESDIIVFSTVRCNASGDIGFVEDSRRLNVMWTRARLGLIIVGDRRTMTTTSELWKKAIESCTEITLPEN